MGGLGGGKTNDVDDSICIKGESNPRRVDGNDPGYHYPINALTVMETNLTPAPEDGFRAPTALYSNADRPVGFYTQRLPALSLIRSSPSL